VTTEGIMSDVKIDLAQSRHNFTVYLFAYTYSYKRAYRKVEVEICGEATVNNGTIPKFIYNVSQDTKIEEVSFFKPFSASCLFLDKGVSVSSGNAYLPYTGSVVSFHTLSNDTEQVLKIDASRSTTGEQTFFARLKDSTGAIHYHEFKVAVCGFETLTWNNSLSQILDFKF
jgi:hypothetical protein